MNTLTDDRADLLAALDLEGLWTRLVGPKARGGGWPCPNPQHSQTGKTPPVSIDAAKGVWFCHGCAASGSAVDLVQYAKGIDTAEAFDILRQWTGKGRDCTESRHGRQSLAHLIAPPAPRPKLGQRQLPKPSPATTGPDAERLMAEYLEHRQWSPETVAAWGLEVVTDPHGRPRIRHPYRSAGELKWWQDRAVGNTEPKWLAPNDSDRFCYALDLVLTLDAAEAARAIIVAEGPPDAIAIWQIDPDLPVVALPGSQGVAKWAPLFADLDVLIALDADAAGDRGAAELGRKLHRLPGTDSIRLRPPDGLDLDDWRRSVGNGQFLAAMRETLDAAKRGQQ